MEVVSKVTGKTTFKWLGYGRRPRVFGENEAYMRRKAGFEAIVGDPHTQSDGTVVYDVKASKACRIFSDGVCIADVLYRLGYHDISRCSRCTSSLVTDSSSLHTS